MLSTPIEESGYPRPDFHRPSPNWRSLNGPWHFLFDDADVGLQDAKWHLTGLPDSVTVSSSAGNLSVVDTAGGKKTVANIAGETLAGTLLKDNAFVTDDQGDGEKVYQRREIIVPFAFQTEASGIAEQGAHEVLWYERTIADVRTEAERKAGNRLLVRFGAVDYECQVWVDGYAVGGHRGGHVPFEVDVTEAVEREFKEAYRLTLRVRDSPFDLTQPRGKQYWAAKPESIFYTPSGGIWQNVWVESMPRCRIGDGSSGTVLRAVNIGSGMLEAQIAVLGRRAGQKCSVEVEASFQGIPVAKSERVELQRERDIINTTLSLHLSSEQLGSLGSRTTGLKGGLALWSPEYPYLYDIAIRLYSSEILIDEIQTTTGIRSISWAHADGTLRLNEEPYFQALVLDQGYWPKTGMTPPSASALREDIELSKKLGFNGCRKHQKVEDPLYLYWADKVGFLVWGEMGNAYQFDEARYVDRFNQEWMESVRRDINHPSIVAWTPVNESWGYTDLEGRSEQRDHIKSLYHMTKTMDPTRPINDNCGWEHVITDLTTFHDYADGPALTATSCNLSAILGPKAGDRALFVGEAKHRSGAPILCTEFGGINITPTRPGEGGEQDWGYHTASDPEDLLRRIEELIYGLVDGGLICGFVYTQLSDIEQEANGLLTFDRREKLDSAKVKAIMDEAQRRYYSMLQK